MMRVSQIFLLISLFAGTGFAGQRSWKIGLVLDSNTSNETYVAGQTTQQSGSVMVIDVDGMAVGGGQSTSNTTVYRVSIRTDELAIAGDDYFYIVQDTTRKSGDTLGLIGGIVANRHHGCHFIVGENLRYSQDKGTLHVIDADGKECKTAILRQARKYRAPSSSQQWSPSPDPSQEAATPERPTLRRTDSAPRADDSDRNGAPDARNQSGVSAPGVIQKVSPEYSEEARGAGLEGTVVLYIEIGTNGRPRNLRVVRSLGHGLDEKAIEAVSQWKFQPTYKDGKPVPVAATIEVNFRLLPGSSR